MVGAGSDRERGCLWIHSKRCRVGVVREGESTTGTACGLKDLMLDVAVDGNVFERGEDRNIMEALRGTTTARMDHRGSA